MKEKKIGQRFRYFASILRGYINFKNYFSADIATKAIGFISVPIFTRLLTQQDYGILAVFSSYVGIMTVILSLNSYASISRVIPFVVIWYIFYKMSSIVGMFIRYAKKTIFQSITVLFAGALNIILNKIFIPKYGYVAAAYTTTISYFVMFLLTFIVVKYFLKKRLTPPLWLLWKPTIIMFGFIAFSYLLGNLGLNAVLFAFIKLMLLGLFSFIVFYKEIRSVLSYNK